MIYRDAILTSALVLIPSAALAGEQSMSASAATTAEASEIIVVGVRGNDRYACSVSSQHDAARSRSVPAQAAFEAAPGPQPQEVTASGAPSSALVLPAGTNLKFVMTDLVTSRPRKCTAGQEVRLELAEAVALNGVTVIPAGTPATGEIIFVQHKGGDGQRGYIVGQLVSMSLGQHEIPIAGKFSDRGTSGTIASMAASMVIPLANLLVTGTSAEIPAGTVVEGKLLVSVNFTGEQPRVAPVRIALAAIETGPALSQGGGTVLFDRVPGPLASSE